MAVQMAIYGVVTLAGGLLPQRLPKNPLSSLMTNIDLSGISLNMLLFSLAFFLSARSLTPF